MKVISFSLAVVVVMQGLVYSQDLRPVVEHGQSVLALNAIGVLVQMDTPPVSSRQTNAYIAQGAEVKAQVTKRGVGKQSRVRVSLRDGTVVKGYISEVDDSSFALTDQKSGKVTTISYEEVGKINRQGLSKPAKVLIICGVTVGALIAIAAAVACHTEGGPHC
jgi:hypothetical protein